MIRRLQALIFMFLNQGVELCKLKKYFWHIFVAEVELGKLENHF